MTAFRCSTEIFSGPGALEALKKFPAARVLVVTDRFFSKSGKALEIGRMVPGAQVQIFDKVVPDPPAALAAEGAAICRSFRPQLLIALGGGSPMDCAKAIRLAYGEKLTFVAVPTTSGSGSEVTSFSVLTHNGTKHPLTDPSLRPDAAILDGALLSQLPSALIADTGMDALSHCLEALAANNRTGFTDGLAFYAAKTVLEQLEESFRGNLSVRASLHEAAAMAGIAFDNAGLGLCHAMAHAVGGAFHIPHGRLCAMLLPEVLAYNMPAAMPQYAALARLIGMGSAADCLAARNLIREIARLRRSLLLPQNLRQAGVEKSQWEEAKTAIAEAVLADPCCRTNPVSVTKDGVMQVLKAVAV